MSRSTFALKFKETVGAPPMEYLTRWRMLRAGDRLAYSGDSISVIALSLGYEPESAFSTAFKKVMGCSPRQYSRRRNLTLIAAAMPFVWVTSATSVWAGVIALADRDLRKIATAGANKTGLFAETAWNDAEHLNQPETAAPAEIELRARKLG
jgi:helix-turn-helix protein